MNDASECWTWTGYRDKDGYGKLRDGKTNKGAHRISYEMHVGEVHDGHFVLHNCNNPACVNPAHLRLGDHLENMADRIMAGHYPANEGAPNVKFSNAIVDSVRKASGTRKMIGAKYGMSASQVGNIKRGDQRPIIREAV